MTERGKPIQEERPKIYVPVAQDSKVPEKVSPKQQEPDLKVDAKPPIMGRTEWIMKMKEIFATLITDFEETLFHKALIMKRIREESKVLS